MKTNELIEMALKEDMPNGDLTTDSLGLGSRTGIAKLIAKADLVLSGRELLTETIQKLAPTTEVKWQFQDGDHALKGQVLCLIKGDLIQLLKAERVGLNLVGRLSGIATLTRRYVDAVAHTKSKILDTRKTIPGYRTLERKAVRDGGGTNHRLNLSTMVLVKDNHIRAVGGISGAVGRIRAHTKSKIIVEARTLEEVSECVKMKVDRILLDNMDNDLLREALQLIPAAMETEASGNMNLERVQSVAETGVQFISVGALTHSANFADISLMFDWSKPLLEE